MDMILIKKLSGAFCLLVFAGFTATARTKTLSLSEAVQLGIQNSLSN